MTALLVENLKLIMLFVLIGAAIGLSRFNGGKTVPQRSSALRGLSRRLAIRL